MKTLAFIAAKNLLESGTTIKTLYVDYPFYVTVDDISCEDDIRIDVEDQVTGAIYQFCSSDSRKCIQNASPKDLVKRVQKNITRL